MKYRAFISYRRQDASAAARWLREKLLGFRPPKALRERVTPERRVDLERRVAYFLDTSYQSANEDFWTANIEPALKESEYLIVLSSPWALQVRDDGSDNWVAREIDTFLKIWGEEEGRRRIVLALADDAPEDRFPGRLNALGTQWDWADLRGVSRLAWLRPGAAERLGDALLKILARIHEVPQELLPLLRQEEARKRGRTRLAAGALAAMVMLGLGGLSWWAIGAERESTRQRDEARRAQARLIAQVAEVQLAGGDYSTALALALEALPRFVGDADDRPYVTEAERALANVVRADVREVAVLAGHGDAIVSARFSPDGGTIVTASADGTARLWSIAGGASRVLSGHGGKLTGASFSPDGTRVLTSAEDRTARLWDAASGRTIAVLEGHRGEVVAAVFSPDGLQLLTASRDGTARLWDALSGRALGVLRGHGGAVNAANFSPDGRRAITASSDQTVRIWDLASGEDRLALPPGSSAFYDAAFSADGTRILTRDFSAGVWDIASGALLARAIGSTVSAGDAVLTADGKRLINVAGDITMVIEVATGRELGRLLETGSGGGALSPDGARMLLIDADTATLADAATGRVIAVLRGATTNYLSLPRFSPDGRQAVIVDYNKVVLWDVRVREQRRDADITVLADAGSNILNAAFSPDGGLLLTIGTDNKVRVWSLDEARQLSAVAFGERPVSLDAQFVRGGEAFVTGVDGVKLWDAATGRHLLTLEGARGFSRGFVSADGSRILSWTEDGAPGVWDAANGRRLATMRGHEGAVVDARISANGRLVLGGGEDGTARLWDAASGRQILVLRHERIEGGPTDPIGVATVHFSPDGTRALTVITGKVVLWNIATGNRLAELGYGGMFYAAEFSPDGRRLFIGADEHSALWDVAPGRAPAILYRAPKPVLSVAFSRDGELMLTSGDLIARLTRTESGARLADLAGHGSQYGPYNLIKTVAFAPDGRRLVTVGPDGSVFVWRHFRTARELVEHACSLLVRPLSREQRKRFFLDEDPKDPPCGWHPDMKDKPRYVPNAVAR